MWGGFNMNRILKGRLNQEIIYLLDGLNRCNLDYSFKFLRTRCRVFLLKEEGKV